MDRRTKGNRIKQIQGRRDKWIKGHGTITQRDKGTCDNGTKGKMRQNDNKTMGW